MGADRAIHVEVAGPEYETMQPLHVAKILAKLSQDEKADLVIVGKQVVKSFYIILNTKQSTLHYYRQFDYYIHDILKLQIGKYHNPSGHVVDRFLLQYILYIPSNGGGKTFQTI